MKLKHWLIGAIILISYSCWNGFSISNQTKEYKTDEKNIKKILILPPEFIAVKEKEASNIIENKKGYDIIVKTIKTGMKDIKMDYTLLNDSGYANTNELFKYIIPLKTELIKSSGLHDNPFENLSKKTYTKKLFARSPKIDPKYGQLSDKYGTQYVMFVGIYTNEKLHYQYVIIADVLKSEIIFRNLKYMRLKATKGNIEPILYDTFYSIKHN
jgi:hypothetical protein